MTDWKTYARGIHLKPNDAAQNLIDYDYVVAEIGEQFTNNIQAAYNAHKPIILFAPSGLCKAVVDQGPDIVDWKIGNQPVIPLLDKYVYSNGVKRAIHGIMLDCSATVDADGHKLNTWWVTKYSDWLLKKVYERYKLPVYLCMNSTPAKEATVDGKQMIINLLREWGVCSVSPSYTVNGYPVALAKPTLPVDDPGIKWYTWLYHTGGKPWLWLYNGNADALYTALNFTAPSDVVIIDTPEQEQDIADLWAAVGALTVEVDGLRAKVTKLEGWITKPL